MTMNSKMMILILLRAFMAHTPALGTNVWVRVTTTMTPIATPRSCHADALSPAATQMFEAKTMQPLAVNPNRTACVLNTMVARYFGYRYTASRYT